MVDQKYCKKCSVLSVHISRKVPPFAPPFAPDDCEHEWVDVRPDSDIQQWTSTQDKPSLQEQANDLFDKPDTSLSLLVIDAGECCFLKVESGRYERKLFDDDMGGLGFRIIGHPFTAVRGAIDSQDKPYPRLERDWKGDIYLMLFAKQKAGDPDCMRIVTGDYDALSELAGHPLPIWDGGGTWTLLKGSEIPGIAMYRYTRGGE